MFVIWTEKIGTLTSGQARFEWFLQVTATLSGEDFSNAATISFRLSHLARPYLNPLVLRLSVIALLFPIMEA